MPLGNLEGFEWFKHDMNRNDEVKCGVIINFSFARQRDVKNYRSIYRALSINTSRDLIAVMENWIKGEDKTLKKFYF